MAGQYEAMNGEVDTTDDELTTRTKKQSMNNTTDNEEQSGHSEQQTIVSEGKTTDERQPTTDGQQQTTIGERQTTDDEHQTTNDKHHTTDSKQQTTDSEQQTTDSEQQTIDSKQQTIDSEQQTRNRERPVLIVHGDEMEGTTKREDTRKAEEGTTIGEEGTTIGEEGTTIGEADTREADDGTTIDEEATMIGEEASNNEKATTSNDEGTTSSELNTGNDGKGTKASKQSPTGGQENLEDKDVKISKIAVGEDGELSNRDVKLSQTDDNLEREDETGCGRERKSNEGTLSNLDQLKEHEVPQEYISLIEHLNEEHDKDMVELRTTLEDDYNQQVLKISDELRDHYQNEMDDKIAKLEEDWEQEFAKQKMEFDKQITAVQKDQWNQCQEAIERVTLDAEDQLKNMKHGYERETAEYRRRIQELMDQQTLSEVKEQEINEEKCQKESEQSEKIKTLEKQLSEERIEVETQMSGVKNEIKDLKAAHQREMEQLRLELEKKYSVILTETRNEMKKRYQDELDEKVARVESHLREQYEKDLERTNEELRESSITLKSKYEKQLSEVVGELEELHEKNLEHELKEAKLKKEYEHLNERVKQLKEQNEEKVDKELDEKNETLNEMSSQLTSLQLKFKEVENENAELKSKHKQEVLHIESIYQEKLEQLNTELESRNTTITEKETTVTEQRTIIADKEATITQLQSTIGTHKANIDELQTTITDLKTDVTKNDSITVDQQATISRLEATIIDRNTIISDLNSKITQQDGAIAGQQTTITDQQVTITEQQATITELETTGSARELEIANLILQSPLPSAETENEFDFSGEPEEKVRQLEKEITKYKKKIKELEEEAEDKFETTFCQKYEHEESPEEIMAKANTLVEKIESECDEKVESLTKKLEMYDDRLKEQTLLRKELGEKLKKIEKELEKERERSKELSKLKKHLDMNHNLMNYEKTSIQKTGPDITNEESEKRIDEVKKEYDTFLQKLKDEISRKDGELSKITNEKETIEMLEEKLKNEGEKFEELVKRTKDQKKNYESEIALMQKEIKTLLQETKDKEKKCQLADEYQNENILLQAKIKDLEKTLVEASTRHEKEIKDLEKAMADSSSKYEVEIKRLQEIIERKESSFQNLQNIHKSLEISSRDITADIEILKKKFQEKENKLVREIQEKTEILEQEKSTILENSFQEKEELMTRIKDLERLCEVSDIWLESDERSGASDDIEKEYDLESKELGKDEDHSGFKNIGGYNWIDKDNHNNRGTDEDNERPIIRKDKPFPWNKNDTQDNEGYMESYEDNGEQHDDYRMSEDRDVEFDIKEIEDEKREMEIELIVEREERGRLRRELGTMTKCVSVFHVECESLKKTLDNTLDMLEMIKEERNSLIEQRDQNMNETSEIIQDLIKYEEIIRKLELGNEKLEEEKEILLQCIQQTNNHSNDVSRKEIQTAIRRNRQTRQLGEELENISIPRNGRGTGRIRENFLESGGEMKTEEDGDGLESGRIPTKKSKSEGFQRDKQRPRKIYSSRMERRNSSERQGDLGQLQTEEIERSTSSQLRFTPDAESAWKVGEKSHAKDMKHFTEKSDQWRTLREWRDQKNISKKNPSDFSENKNHNLSSGNFSRSSKNITPQSSSKKMGIVPNSFLTSTRINSHVKLRLIPNLSGLSPIVSQLERRQHERMLKWQVTDDQPSRGLLDDEDDTTFLMTADPYGRAQTRRTFTTREMPNWRRTPSTQRQTPDTRRQSPSTQRQTPCIRRQTPSSLRQTPSSLRQTPSTRRSHDRSASFPKRKDHMPQRDHRVHFRSHSADDRAMISPYKGSRFESFEYSNLDTPLAINFEDYIHRHRVKSSENIANLRDASPAELWFS